MISGKPDKTAKVLIAPCGINCRLCRAYIREKKPCPGCRGDDSMKLKSCIMCRIKNCENIVKKGFKYCFRCHDFPCILISRLDKRYSTKYGTSVIENLSNIKKSGITEFIKSENKKWICKNCGEMICMHKPECLSCGQKWLV